MTSLVNFTRALGDTTRWRIVRLVTEDALCVCELAEILEMPQSTLSSHVQILRKAGLLESEKAEKWTYFRIDRSYCRLILNLEQFFGSVGSEEWAGDDARAAARLARRAESCCPGPVKLRARNRKKSLSSIP